PRLSRDGSQSLWSLVGTLMYCVSGLLTRKILADIGMILGGSLVFTIVLSLLTILSPPPIPRFVYSKLRKARFRWQRAKGLADETITERFTQEALIEKLDLMKTAAVSAHWLLVPLSADT